MLARVDPPLPAAGHSIRAASAEATLAAAAFAALFIVVLSVAAQAAEPDDGAYRTSIVAMTEGHFLTLSTAQAETLARKLPGDNPTAPPNQWVELPSGRYISEKDPGYPFLAAPFEKLGVIRFTPLFYGLLACLGLFIGARRWLGRLGGPAAVGLYCSSGAALAFAWRDYMPTFTDASLVAAGSGLLLWTVLATEANSPGAPLVRPRRIHSDRARDVRPLHQHRDPRLRRRGRDRRVAAAHLEAGPPHALLVACVSGRLLCRHCHLRRPRLRRPVENRIPTRRGHLQPRRDRAEPAPHARAPDAGHADACARTGGARVDHRAVDNAAAATVAKSGLGGSPDFWAGVALAASWIAIWGLYSAYTWTIDPTSVTVQVVRVCVPALGAIALLGSWLVTRIPGHTRWAALTTAAMIAAVFGLGVWSFYAMYGAFGAPLG